MSTVFTHEEEEYAGINFIYEFCNGNTKATVQEFWWLFPN
jgi:hypothetical protein